MSHIDRALSRALTKSVWLTLACLTQSTPSTETATIFNNGGRDAHGDNVQAYLWNVQKSAAIFNIQQWEWGMRAVIMFNAKCSSISLKWNIMICYGERQRWKMQHDQLQRCPKFFSDVRHHNVQQCSECSTMGWRDARCAVTMTHLCRVYSLSRFQIHTTYSVPYICQCGVSR